MSGLFLLDWATLAVSFFNTALLLWLGLMVLMTAERQTWGIWLSGGGLLLGGLFFLSHSAILGSGLNPLSPEVLSWWLAGWISVTGLPLAWYVVILWYAGFFDDRSTRFFQQNRFWLAVAAVLFALSALLPLFLDVRTTAYGSDGGGFSATSLALPSGLLWVYPLYILVCMLLALNALRRPGPSRRVMGMLARRRARPWLQATTAVFLVVGFLVAAALAWIVPQVYGPIETTIAWFDLAIAGLIGAAILLLGQAVVSYEVFTGRVLPRRGLLRHWRRAVVLAAGYSLLLSGSLTAALPALYGMLLSLVLTITFFALLSWRLYLDRERYFRDLQPFVRSPRMVDQLLDDQGPEAVLVDLTQPFRALCQDVIGTKTAYLIPLGPLAALAGPPLVYPESDVPAPPVGNLLTRLASRELLCEPVDPAHFGDTHWAVPLWGTRGLIGVLLLGEKLDGGLFTQEEIETARSSGERLIDTRASAALSARLMALQRDRFFQTQVVDQQARRVLHDEILPRLHAVMLDLSPASGGRASGRDQAIQALSDVHHQISDLLREMPASTSPEVHQFGLAGALQQMLSSEFENAFDEILWECSPATAARADRIPRMVAEVLYYAARETVRNAARYGRPESAPGLFVLRMSLHWNKGLCLTVEDNGVGFELTGEGDGQGLALHSTLMAVVGGALAVESLPGAGTRVVLTLAPAGPGENDWLRSGR